MNDRQKPNGKPVRRGGKSNRPETRSSKQHGQCGGKSARAGIKPDRREAKSGRSAQAGGKPDLRGGMVDRPETQSDKQHGQCGGKSAQTGGRLKRPATYQDVLDAPENMVAEVVRGTLHTQPRPATPHARAYSVLGSVIGGPFDNGLGGPGGWWIIAEPELHLGYDILVPDIAGWRRETLLPIPQGAFISIAPDWVCEILSPSTRAFDLDEKRPIYARESVGHLWLVDPVARTLEAYELRDGAWALIGKAKDEEMVSLPPFDAISFSLGKLWWPEPPPLEE